MQKYEQMIGSAKDNFADIPIGKGPLEECTICCKSSDIFGLGTCRHPICIECAIRMRVLSSSNQCPVCRATMETLWLMFVSAGLGTASLSFSSLESSGRETICHSISKCGCFETLREVSVSCVQNLEKNALILGRPSNGTISYRDRDVQKLERTPFLSLLRSTVLRRGIPVPTSSKRAFLLPVFGHAELLDHYKEKHFLCDFEECRAMGIAFSNQMDLNLHKSKEHSGRRAPVAIDFQFNDRQLAGPSRTRREGPPSAPAAPLARRDKIAVVQQDPPPPPKRTPEEFVVVPSAQSRTRTVRYNVAPAFVPQTQDFPSLGNSTPDQASNVSSSSFEHSHHVCVHALRREGPRFGEHLICRCAQSIDTRLLPSRQCFGVESHISLN
ncbi:hypothetical protein COOONC_01577 [Cooperia oncophora]